MKLYKLQNQALLLTEDKAYLSPVLDSWDKLINRDDLYNHLKKMEGDWKEVEDDFLSRQETIDAPVGPYQEVWAAGVTYQRSREARMEESKSSGGDRFYDLVYEAERPELFFKALGFRVRGHQEDITIRKDSTWNVPEPELTLFITSSGKIAGYSVGNDVSSRSIEGENPLYLPQAKVYDGSAALGPCLYVPENPVPPDTIIDIRIRRGSEIMYQDSTRIDMMKRSQQELADYLLHSQNFENGAFLMTGTCLVPGNDFTLKEGDVVDITITGIGTLSNRVKINQK